MKSLMTVCALACAAALPLVAGCSRTVAHSSTDRQTWTGGTEHTDTSVIRNPDGTERVVKDRSYSNP